MAAKGLARIGKGRLLASLMEWIVARSNRPDAAAAVLQQASTLTYSYAGQPTRRGVGRPFTKTSHFFAVLYCHLAISQAWLVG